MVKNVIFLILFLPVFLVSCRRDPEPEPRDTEGWTLYDTSNTNLHFNWIKELAIDNENNIWFINDNIFIGKFNGENSLSIPIPSSGSSPDHGPSDLAIDANNNVWVRNWINGMMRYDGDWRSFPPKMHGFPNRNPIHADRSGNIYTRWGQVIYKYISESIDTIYIIDDESKFGPSDLKFQDFTMDYEDGIWVLEQSQPALYYLKDSIRKTYISTNPSVPKNRLLRLITDKNNTKWMTTPSAELISFDGKNWEIYKPDIPLKLSAKIVSAPDLSIWIPTDGYGVVRFKNEKWQIYNSRNSGLPSDWVSSIVADNNGTMWIGTGDGLSKFKPK